MQPTSSALFDEADHNPYTDADDNNSSDYHLRQSTNMCSVSTSIVANELTTTVFDSLSLSMQQNRQLDENSVNSDSLSRKTITPIDYSSTSS